jgi:hypothetical protein
MPVHRARIAAMRAAREICTPRCPPAVHGPGICLPPCTDLVTSDRVIARGGAGSTSGHTRTRYSVHHYYG